jgi:hypothetical protein
MFKLYWQNYPLARVALNLYAELPVLAKVKLLVSKCAVWSV